MRFTAARSRLWGLLRAGTPFLIIGLLAGCMLPPEPKTETAKEVFGLYVAVLVMGGIVFVGVEGFILYAAVRYRRKPGDDLLPPQVHGNTVVEIIWTIIPTVIVLILFVISTITLNAVEARATKPSVTVEATGFQWQWRFRYLDGDSNPKNDAVVNGTAANPPVMALPIGEPIRVILPSLDVIHSFFVPQFLIKRDVVPVGENGTPNELEFTISEEGTYTGQCAEFCGLQHANMTFAIQGLTRAKYDKWLKVAQSGASPAPSAAPNATVIKLSATGTKFSTGRIQVPAGQPFVIRFEITDGQNHNVAISKGGQNLFTGEIFQGPGVREYQVPALPAGEYQFICQVHPQQMTGTIVAGP
ncbi:MAG: cytochrome c oxidase subunit II [Chloroflexota bacterium]|nr:cytochrome c oxidase subunit II [Chloroflexota bacterium]